VRAEEALRSSEKRYRSLFEQSPVGIYRTTPEGSILLANQKLVAMLGYANAEELQGLNLESAGFGTDTPRTQFKEALARDGEVRGFESRWVRKDGTQVVVRETATRSAQRMGVSLLRGRRRGRQRRSLAEEARRRLAAPWTRLPRRS
jgi:PAS domain S-box-containing protein